MVSVARDKHPDRVGRAARAGHIGRIHRVPIRHGYAHGLNGEAPRLPC